MQFGSVCSGIESASVAWSPLGWRAAFVAEVDPFACAVLAHHFPHVLNHGNVDGFQGWPDANIDCLVGGTPCQSFSRAGRRRGMDDARGRILFAYLAMVRRFRPRWVVYENVPGILSTDGGRDFGALLAGLAELGYGFAYRILNAQYFGLPQRRRRVFVVGNLGNWRRAATVLFERESLRGNPSPGIPEGNTITGPFVPGSHASGFNGQDVNGHFYAIVGGRVRRLTPRECERLQGFPDNYTCIPWRGRLASDGVRYAAIGNAMAVPVMRWIGERVARADAMATRQ